MKPRDESQEESSGAKYQRTLTMTQDMDDRIRRVCDHLGVTVSAYLKQVIGESVARHEVTLYPAQAAQNQQVMLGQFFEQMAAQVSQMQAEEEVPRAKRPGRKAPGA